MPIIKVNNRNVHYQEMNAGAQETVLMIHGMFSNLSVFYFNIAPVLALHYHVIMYDLKGHGMSEKITTGYGLEAMTDDVLALMDALDLKTAHVAGYSYGGLIALKMALRFPERVTKLAIIEAPDPSDRETLQELSSYSRELLMYGIEKTAQSTGRWMGKRQLERNIRTYEFLFKETSIQADMAAEIDLLSDQQIYGIEKDTLLLYGTGSNCIPAANKLSTMITYSKPVFLLGDHNIPVQQPIATSNELNTFFKQQHSATFI